MKKKFNDWWERVTTPYSEKTIDELVAIRARKSWTAWPLLILDFILFMASFGVAFLMLDTIRIIVVSEYTEVWILTVPMAMLAAIMLIIFLSNRMHTDFIAVDTDHDIADLFIYLKRFNNEFETPEELKIKRREKEK